MLPKAKGRAVPSPSGALGTSKKGCFPLHCFGGVLSTHGPPCLLGGAPCQAEPSQHTHMQNCSQSNPSTLELPQLNQ